MLYRAVSDPLNALFVHGQEEALAVVDQFTARARDLQEGPAMPSEDVDYFSAKVCKTTKTRVGTPSSAFDTYNKPQADPEAVTTVVDTSLCKYFPPLDVPWRTVLPVYPALPYSCFRRYRLLLLLLLLRDMNWFWPFYSDDGYDSLCLYGTAGHGCIVC